MTTDTDPADLALTTTRFFMTIVTEYFCVSAIQRKTGRGMIEVPRLPSPGVMTSVALRSVTTFMLIFFFMTRITI